VLEPGDRISAGLADAVWMRESHAPDCSTSVTRGRGRRRISVASHAMGCQAVGMPTASSARPASTGSPSRNEPPVARWGRAIREALAFCAQPRNLRRTVPIAIVVGIVLTLINQESVIAGGHATAATWARCGLNFVVPFLVSNAGLLSARR
jgi:hypothetical protein